MSEGYARSRYVYKASKCHYRTLGVQEDATEEEIQQVYDYYREKSVGEAERILEEDSLKVENAYRVLINPVTRRNFDNELFPARIETSEEERYRKLFEGDRIHLWTPLHEKVRNKTLSEIDMDHLAVHVNASWDKGVTPLHVAI